MINYKYFIVISFFLLTIPIRGYAQDLPNVIGACTSEENWTNLDSIRLPGSGTNYLTDQSNNLSKNLKIISYGIQLKKGGKTAEQQAAGEFLIARAYYRLGLVHLAFSGFSTLTQRGPNLPRYLKLGVSECLYALHEEYLSLKYPYTVSSMLSNVDFKSLNSNQKESILAVITSIALMKITHPTENAERPFEIRLLPPGSAESTFVLGSEAAFLGDSKRLAYYFENLLKLKTVPKDIQKQIERIKLTLARSYYGLGSFDKAFDRFSQVDPKSEYFADSMVGMSWSSLQRNDFKKSIDSAYNLMTRRMRNAYEPEVPMILGMAAFGTCNFSSALENLQKFNKLYNHTYQWLYQWHQTANNPAEPPHDSLYALLKKQLSATASDTTEEGKIVPRKIISKWATSKVFINDQKEMNLLADEAEKMRNIYNSIDQSAPSADRILAQKSLSSAEISKILKSDLYGFFKNIPTLKQNLTEDINRELSRINVRMTTSWVTTYDNSKLLEIEILSSVHSSDLVRSKSDAPKKAPPRKKAGENALPVLDWGKYNMEDDSNEEIWDDERGALHVDVTNRCDTQS